MTIGKETDHPKTKDKFSRYVSSSRMVLRYKSRLLYLKFLEVEEALTHLRALLPETWGMTLVGSKYLSSLIITEAPRSW